MIYRLTWTEGNGYNCSCHRNTTIEHSDFDSMEELEDLIETLKFRKKRGDDIENYITILEINNEEERTLI